MADDAQALFWALVHRSSTGHPPRGLAAHDGRVTDGFPDVPGLLRRIRRRADLSQRELARTAGLSVSTVAHAEAGTRDLRVGQLARAASCAGLRLVLVDPAGQEVSGMGADSVRDLGGRQFPAHLDVMLAKERPSRLEERRDRRVPLYTYDVDRSARDRDRARNGTPDDHRRPMPDDDPVVRRAQQVRGRAAARREEAQRRREAGERAAVPEWACDCPPGCDAAREVTREVHVEDCPCRCDIS